MVKHAQAIRWLPTSCLSVFDNFAGIALKGLIKIGETITLAITPNMKFK